jgi:hypothetical protein
VVLLQRFFESVIADCLLFMIKLMNITEPNGRVMLRTCLVGDLWSKLTEREHFASFQ